MPTESPVNVRMAQSAVETLRALPSDQAESVARAIQRIGIEPGIPLRIPGNQDDGTSLVMLPDNDQAPVVAYRLCPPLEGGGYLVTGLIDRHAYNTYVKGGQPGFFETPAGKALLIAGAAVAIAIVLSRSNTSGGTQ